MLFIILFSSNRYPPVVILNITKFTKNIKIFIFLTYHLCSPAGRSFLYMLLGLLTALSYSDLVKSWRGECGGGGIVGNHVWVTVVACTCMLSCTPHKVIA